MARPKKNIVIEHANELDQEISDEIEAQVDEVESPVMMQEDVEYKGYTIIIEPHGRVIVTDRGLHVVEFVDVEAKLFTLIDKAKEHIDVSL